MAGQQNGQAPDDCWTGLPLGFTPNFTRGQWGRKNGAVRKLSSKVNNAVVQGVLPPCSKAAG
jgi:hypothetical protein